MKQKAEHLYFKLFNNKLKYCLTFAFCNVTAKLKENMSQNAKKKSLAMTLSTSDAICKTQIVKAVKVMSLISNA